MPSFGNAIEFNCVVTESMRAKQITSQSLIIPDYAVDRLFNPHTLKDNTISPILLGIKLKPTLMGFRLSPVKSFSKSYTAYRISDKSDAVVIALGITAANVNDYRYHVVINDSAEVVHWSKIPTLESKYGAIKPYGFIGKFCYPGKQVLVEVVNIKNYQIRDGVLFDWREDYKPFITNVIVNGTHYEVKRDIKKTDQNYFLNKKVPFSIKRDPLTGEITEISLIQDSVSSIQLILKEHPMIDYNVSMVNAADDTYFTAAEGDNLQPNFTFHAVPPFSDKYEIVIRPQVSGVDIKGQTLRIPVIILPSPIPEKKVSLKQLLPLVTTILIIIGLLFWLYRRCNNIRLAKSLQAKQAVNLKLRYIRAQLNPHFMFNALSSIQNLVNKNDIESANRYLSRFADLTRSVLNTGEDDLISLEDELKILDDYLQMEQLRFNFKYELQVDKNINVANAEVPAMLLQPFLENAVKHGVANLREKGTIKVLVNQNNNDLILSILDNGAGFQQKKEEANGSFGLKLSEERIQLLNQVYKDQPASLAIKSDETGTTVTITLTNWIS